jgi:hypothetical protein
MATAMKTVKPSGKDEIVRPKVASYMNMTGLA